MSQPRPKLVRRRRIVLSQSLREPVSGAWRSLVARLLWEQQVLGSNPGAPTIACIAKEP